MKKKKVWRTKPIKDHFEGGIVGRISGAKVIIGIDEAKGKYFTKFYRFGFGGELIVNDEMGDVSDWAKDKAKKLTEENDAEV